MLLSKRTLTKGQVSPDGGMAAHRRRAGVAGGQAFEVRHLAGRFGQRHLKDFRRVILISQDTNVS